MNNVHKLVPQKGTWDSHNQNLPAILEFNGLRYPTSGHWPVVMRADMAAAYTDMRTVKDFREAVRVGLMPLPLPGRIKKFQIWRKADLDDFLGITNEADNIDEKL